MASQPRTVPLADGHIKHIVPLIWVLMAGVAGASEEIRLWTGPPGGFYDFFGREFKKTAEGQNLRVLLITSHGSRANLEALVKAPRQASNLQLALVQEDSLRSFLKEGKGSSLLTFGEVFKEHLLIFVRRPLGIKTVSDFQGYRAYMGAPHSGSRSTAQNFLDLTITRNVRDIYQQVKDLGQLPDAFQKKQVDLAIMITKGDLFGLEPYWQNSYLKALFESEHARLFSLDLVTRRKLTSNQERHKNFFFSNTTLNLPSVEMGAKGRKIATVAVSCLLVTSRPPPPRINALLERVWQELSGPEYREMRLGQLSGLSIPPIPVSSRISSRPASWNWVTFINQLNFFILSGLIILIFFRYKKLVLRLHQSAPILSSLIGFFVGLMLCGMLAYQFEHKVNENFETPFEAFWSVVVYILSGFEDRSPLTPMGRFISAIAISIGTLFFAVVLAALVQFYRKLEEKMPAHLKDHYLILNYNSKVKNIIKEIHSPILGPSVVVIFTDDDNLNMREVRKEKARGAGGPRYFDDVYFAPGDPTDKDSLLDCNPHDAEMILVLADERLGEHADEKSFRTLFALNKIFIQKKVSIRVVVEILNPDNVEVLEQIMPMFRGEIEVVCGANIQGLLLSQAVLTTGLAGFLRDLLTVSGSTNEVYTVAIPDNAAGKTFPQYAAMVMSHFSDSPIIPIAIQRQANGYIQTHTNPQPRLETGKANPIYHLCKGDRLLVISFLPPSPEKFPLSTT